LRALDNLKVRTRLTIGFSTVVLCLIATSAYCLFEVSVERRHVEELKDHWLPAVRSSLEMQANLRKVQLNEFRAAGAATLAESVAAESRIDAALADYRLAASAYPRQSGEPVERAAFDDILARRQAYFGIDKALRTLGRQGNLAAAMTLMLGPGKQIREAIEQDIEAIVQLNQVGAAREGEQADQVSRRAVTSVLVAVAIAVATAVYIATAIGRGLTKQLGGEPQEAAEIAGQIASGNFDVSITLAPGDGTSLMFSLASMREKLTVIVGDIKRATDSIANASAEIAIGNNDLSGRTEEQAASLEQTVASVDELTGTVRHTADNANQAAALVEDACSAAERGGEAVRRQIETMHGISESAAKVTAVVGVIEDIAFQTNILALNAAVEAARAGAQGRGFAVVASEVRNLAQRSATSAREIKALINESAERVASGEKQGAVAGKTISEAIRSVQRVSKLMREIASASDEQSTGLAQINQAMAQMDDVTQRNAALVEQASAAAETMVQQVQMLRGSVEVFSIGS
jgi:methyl-accepting chemotaxis protein